MATNSINLEDVPSESLMTELLRRMKCASKPDKRLILIGTLSLFSLNTNCFGFDGFFSSAKFGDLFCLDL